MLKSNYLQSVRAIETLGNFFTKVIAVKNEIARSLLLYQNYIQKAPPNKIVYIS